MLFLFLNVTLYVLCLSPFHCVVLSSFCCYCVVLLFVLFSYYCVVLCIDLCTVTLPPGVNPIAVDKYIYPSSITRLTLITVWTYCATNSFRNFIYCKANACTMSYTGRSYKLTSFLKPLWWSKLSPICAVPRAPILNSGTLYYGTSWSSVHEETWGNNGTKNFNHPTAPHARFKDVLRQIDCHIEQTAH